MNNFFSPDLIFFVMVAAFLVLRLRNVLGRRTGNEKKIGTEFSFGSKVIEKNSKNKKQIKTNTVSGLFSQKGQLEKINELDKNFSIETFLEGAKDAFKIIVESYSKENIKKINYLLSPDILKVFSIASKNRIKKKQLLEHSFISFKSAEIKKIVLKSTIVEIIVKFVTEQVNLLRNNRDMIIEGNEDNIEKHVDYWTFSKDLKSLDPNWKLIDTKAGK